MLVFFRCKEQKMDKNGASRVLATQINGCNTNLSVFIQSVNTSYTYSNLVCLQELYET